MGFRRLTVQFVCAAMVLQGAAFCQDQAGEKTAPLETVAWQVIGRYGSIPKGVVLEGTGTGLGELKSLTYDKKQNVFTINEKITYKNPVQRKDFRKILKALDKDDRIGVTLIEGEPRVYGTISASDRFVKPLIETDRLLGGVIYGLEHLLTVKLPENYQPKRAVERKIPVVACAIFNDFQFKIDPKAETCALASCNIDIHLIPLAEEKTPNGGHLPDTKKMNEYVMEDSDRANIQHLKKHQAEYLKIPFVGETAAVGEAVAFARWVRDSKITTEELQKSLD